LQSIEEFVNAQNEEFQELYWQTFLRSLRKQVRLNQQRNGGDHE
jgi:hypothetical protein